MKSDLILVANATHARLLTRESPEAHLVHFESLEHPQGRFRSSELGDDRLGHGSKDSHPGGISFEPRLDPRRKHHLEFARVLAARVEELLGSGRYGRVAVYASAPFLGELRTELGAATRKVLHGTIDHDLTGLGIVELERRVAADLGPAKAG